MLDDVLPYLACPYCGAGLTRTGSALHCARGHAFNVARQGYASLLPKQGDQAALAARVRSQPARVTATVSVRVSVFRPSA